MIRITYTEANEDVFTTRLICHADISRNNILVGNVNISGDLSLTDHRRLMKKFEPVEIKLPTRMNAEYAEYLNNHPHIRKNLKGLKVELGKKFRSTRMETIVKIVKLVSEQLKYQNHSAFDQVELECSIVAFDKLFNGIICAEEFYKYLYYHP